MSISLSERIRSLLSNRASNSIKFLYLLLFWALILRLYDLLHFPLGPLAKLAFFEPYANVFFDASLLILIGTVLLSTRESIKSLGPYKEVQREVPRLVKDLVGSESQDSENALISKIQELLVKTRTASEIRLMRFISLIARLTKKHHKIIVPLFTLTNLLVYVGLILVTIRIYYLLAPIPGNALPWINYVSDSPTAIVIILGIISTVNFGSVIQELQLPAWQAIRRAMRNPFLIFLRFVEEFTIATRIGQIVDTLVWGITFWGTYRGKWNVQIIERSRKSYRKLWRCNWGHRWCCSITLRFYIQNRRFLH